ncbi:MAG: aspartate-semialdehyde dehydrogenase, partial [Oscillospiraceae bacterium]
MKEFNLAILGASGAVGSEMLKILEERKFPIKNLRLLSGRKSAGKKLVFKGREYTFEMASDEAFKGCDIVLGAAEGEISQRFVNAIKASGAVYIDNSSAFRLEKDVPLVIPEINGGDILPTTKVISNPNCSTIITLMAVAPIHRLYNIEAMVVSTYQAVSGAGAQGLEELNAQIKAVAENMPCERKIFPYQIVNNLIPQIGDFLENGYSQEEMKLQNEGRKIFHAPDLKVSCTTVRVPVMRSHSISVNLFCEEKPDLGAVRDAIEQAKGLVLCDSPSEKIYPMPLLSS